MQAYYQDNLTTIYNCDCREILSELDYDVIITDPIWPNFPPDIFDFDGDPADLLAEVLRQSKAKRVVIVMRHDSDPRFLKAVPDSLPFFCCQFMTYVVPHYIGRKLGGCEVAYCFGEPIPSREHQRVIPHLGPRVQKDNCDTGDFFCPRNLYHMRFLINWWTEINDIVLDPFCGSGTTLRAAADLYRQSIGIDVSRQACDISINRMAQTVLPISC